MECFLKGEFGEEKGISLYKEMQAELNKILEHTKGKSENQMKVLTNTILPHVALYHVLGRTMDKEEAFEIIHRFLCEHVAVKMHSQYQKMEKIPCFFAIYSYLFRAYTKKSDAWTSKVIEKDSKHVCVDITECLWYQACAENNCPELCKCFCDSDEVTYGGLKKLRFERTQTIGTGGSKCDFKFYKK